MSRDQNSFLYWAVNMSISAPKLGNLWRLTRFLEAINKLFFGGCCYIQRLYNIKDNKLKEAKGKMKETRRTYQIKMDFYQSESELSHNPLQTHMV